MCPLSTPGGKMIKITYKNWSIRPKSTSHALVTQITLIKSITNTRQNAVCKFCTSRQSFGHCPFIPRLKNMLNFCEPFKSTKIFWKMFTHFFWTFLHFFDPQVLYQFLYYVEFPLICSVPLIRWTHPLSLLPLPCFQPQLVRHIFHCTCQSRRVYPLMVPLMWRNVGSMPHLS